jgi:hypothetical protein
MVENSPQKCVNGRVTAGGEKVAEACQAVDKERES